MTDTTTIAAQRFLDATAAFSLRDMPRCSWLHVIYTDSNGQFHSEHWACSFTEAEQRLADIGATQWEIGA